jgi:hypothetical protein
MEKKGKLWILLRNKNGEFGFEGKVKYEKQSQENKMTAGTVVTC